MESDFGRRLDCARPDGAKDPLSTEAMACPPKNPIVKITKPMMMTTTDGTRLIINPAIINPKQPIMTRKRPSRLVSRAACAEDQVPARYDKNRKELIVAESLNGSA